MTPPASVCNKISLYRHQPTAGRSHLPEEQWDQVTKTTGLTGFVLTFRRPNRRLCLHSTEGSEFQGIVHTCLLEQLTGYRAIVINAINYTVAFPAMTNQSVCCEKDLFTFGRVDVFRPVSKTKLLCPRCSFSQCSK